MSDFPIQPLMDRVFVKKDDMSVDKDTGFHLPDTVKGRAQTGTVVAVGPGYLNTNTGDFHPTTVKVGDRVFIKEFDGYIVRYNGHEVFVFREQEILGRVLD
jgi:chaperonin GroES